MTSFCKNSTTGNGSSGICTKTVYIVINNGCGHFLPLGLAAETPMSRFFKSGKFEKSEMDWCVSEKDIQI